LAQDECVVSAELASSCNFDQSCFCKDQTYLAAVEACLQNLCDAADQNLWAAYNNRNCASMCPYSNHVAKGLHKLIYVITDVGIFSVFSSVPTTTQASTFTNGNGVAATGAIPSASAFQNGGSTAPASSSNSQSDSGSLSVGDIAGIASAVFGGVAVIIAVLAWRLPHQRKKVFKMLKNIS